MYVRVRSHVPRIDQLRSRRLMTGRFAANSQVLLCSVPAFFHCELKPRLAGVGTGRIWFFVVEFTCVISMPSRSNNVKSEPASVSRVVSGLSNGLPAWPSEQPCTLQAYVSYCASNRGELPAVPFDARRRKSLMYGTCQNGSSETRHTTDARPNGAQRLPWPKSELPSYRNVPSTM